MCPRTYATGVNLNRSYLKNNKLKLELAEDKFDLSVLISVITNGYIMGPSMTIAS